MPGSLAARDISKSYAAVQVLDRVSLVVSPGDRVGIVGPNGIGKSTLLRVLAGLEQPDRGRIVRGGAVGLLPQEPEAREGETVLGYLARRTGVGAAEHEMDELAARLGDEPELAGAYGDALDRFLALGGEDFEARARAVLSDVGLGPRTERQMTSLSGGEAARAALAAILLARFDVFLLDEPTNNLDFAGLARLERFLDDLAAGVVLVSHDRAFLDRCVTRVVEIEAETRKVHEYTGTWTRVRGGARAGAGPARARLRRLPRRAEPLLRAPAGAARGGAPARRRAQARAPDGRLRPPCHERPPRQGEPGEEPPRAAGGGREAVDALAAAARPADGGRGRRTRGGARRGRRRARLVHARPGLARAALGRPPRGRRRERLGKSTLIGALLGDLPLAAGTRRLGPSVVFGELNQARDQFSGVLLADFVEASGLLEAEARTLLAKFSLGPEDIVRPAPRLSPGERTRAGLALLSATGVNCLVLDEPTNHLDLEAIEELETALETYEGCLVVVTHDRRFLERLSVSRTLEL